MLTLTIPDREVLTLEHLVCDMNGTLAVDGVLLKGVAERIAALGAHLAVHVLTADTYGTREHVAAELATACAAAGVSPPHWEHVARGAEKERYVTRLGAERVVAIGNGTNDEAMFRAAALRIGVLTSEGIFAPTLLAAHVVVISPLDALDLLRFPRRLTATLRP